MEKESEIGEQLKTPVLFVVFNRPQTTRRVLAALREVRPLHLFVAADGPRGTHPLDDEQCLATRAILDEVDWDCTIYRLFHQENLGCKNALSMAITWFFEHVEAGIILEDDCLPSPSFFPFCSELLHRYQDDQNVMMISGSNLQGESSDVEASYYFSKIPVIWGWASWRRAWQNFDKSMEFLPSILKEGRLDSWLGDRDVFNYWLSCFVSAYDGKIDTWGYPWVFSIMKEQGICIVPQKNLVKNIGFGEGATHTTDLNNPSANAAIFTFDEIRHPKDILVNDVEDARFYRRVYNIGFYNTKSGLFRLRKRWRNRVKMSKRLLSICDEN